MGLCFGVYVVAVVVGLAVVWDEPFWWFAVFLFVPEVGFRWEVSAAFDEVDAALADEPCLGLDAGSPCDVVVFEASEGSLGGVRAVVFFGHVSYSGVASVEELFECVHLCSLAG